MPPFNLETLKKAVALPQHQKRIRAAGQKYRREAPFLNWRELADFL
jgi:hypothetical protein